VKYVERRKLEYVGRKDNQVKVRGYRIELGEIEGVMNGHEGVREGVVVVREEEDEGRTDKRLVAYVVPKEKNETVGMELRNYLKDRLPDYMVPTNIVLMEALPLTPNGKIDHRALSISGEKRSSRQNSFVAPRNLIELHIAEIWESILNIRPIGATDNFFDLGGHSVLALRVSAQIYKKFGYELPLSAFFAVGTVEHLASIIRNQAEIKSTHLIELQAGGSKPPIFLMHPIGGGVVCYVYLARYLAEAGHPVYALQALEKDDPHTQVETMAASYIEAMREAQPKGPYFLGGWSFGSYVAFEVAQQLKRAGEEVKFLAMLDNVAPGDPADLPEDDPLNNNDPIALARILESFANAKEPLPISEDYLRQLGPDDQLLYIMDQAKKARIMPQELNLHQVKRSLYNFKSRVQASLNYAPQVYPGKITLLQCAETLNREKEFSTTDPTWGWGELSSEPVEIHLVTGSHESMVAEPDVQGVAAKLKDCIDKLDIE